MSVKKQHVMIKGINDALVFHLSDQCEFPDLIHELRHKLEHTHQHILTGPITHVHIKLGTRIIIEEQENQIRELMKTKGNLIIQSIESDPPKPEEHNDELKMLRGIIRSGQSVFHKQSILYLGDINPGGTIMSEGSIYIMGSLRGVAHAGFEGDDQAVIAASHLRPTQLRIADVISRPPDEWGIDEAFMEFAYLKNNTMEIDKLLHLHRIRPEITQFKESE